MTPQELATEAACFSCIPRGLYPAVITYLLNRIANTGLTPEQLMEQAKCFACLPEGSSNANQAFLLNYILENCGGGGGGDCGWCFGPSNSFTTIDEIYLYLFDSESVSSPNLLTVPGPVYAESESVFTSFSAPILETIGGSLNLLGPLTSINLNSLQTVGSNIAIWDYGTGNLVSVSLPSLVSCQTGFSLNGNSNLASVSIPVFVPPDGLNIIIQNASLTDTSVNHILARCVANAGYVSGNINLSGGSSSAPTGQGILDAATLTGRGVTVTTN